MILQVLSPTLITHPKTVQCIHPSAYPGCETIQHQLMHMFCVLGTEASVSATGQHKNRAWCSARVWLWFWVRTGPVCSFAYWPPKLLTVLLGGLPFIIVRRAQGLGVLGQTDELHSNRIHAWHIVSWPTAAGISFSDSSDCRYKHLT